MTAEDAVRDRKADWSETATATNATATATHAAESGHNHLISLVSASFTGSGNTAELVIRDGSAVIYRADVHDDMVIPFTEPYKAGKGNKVEAELGAGGSSVDGHVSILGRTELNE